MADEEKLIAAAFQSTFKNTKIPPELYDKRQHELKVEEHELVKVNMTLKRGLVLDIEDDSHFRTFLKYGSPYGANDIVLTVNDKVAGKADFKLHDLFKEKGCKVHPHEEHHRRASTLCDPANYPRTSSDYDSRFVVADSAG
ncbi:hypothetical protein PMAYCL1PPCAC_03146 [Pristionchus mayeri]|uniref:Uncharacterized protein n=1 Tax=Pristionchus mayeri TaxID=1317129 RepID=A0AAN4Z5M4_9BILA|nr:hypothetical protein PMAYCL1PPCAC_03146 [Pristionchus mayeri]